MEYHMPLSTSRKTKFTIPARTITAMGFIFVFRSSRKAPRKIPTISQFVMVRSTVPPQKALMRMRIPAEAIMATTAGRRDPRTLWSTARFLYFRYSLAMFSSWQTIKTHPDLTKSFLTIPLA